MPQPPAPDEDAWAAVARQNPWGFAFMMYFTLFGIFTFLNEVVMPGRLNTPGFRYLVPFSLILPFVLRAAWRQMRERSATP